MSWNVIALDFPQSHFTELSFVCILYFILRLFSLMNMISHSSARFISDSVQFSHSVVSNSLWPHELQHARPPCPSPSPGVHSNSRPLSRWCHPAISCSVTPFSSCPQSLPASESFPMSQLFTSGGQITGVSALASFLPKKSQGWSPLGWTGWLSFQSKGLSRVFSNTAGQKHPFSWAQLSLWSNSHIHTRLLGKPQLMQRVETADGRDLSSFLLWEEIFSFHSVRVWNVCFTHTETCLQGCYRADVSQWSAMGWATALEGK